MHTPSDCTPSSLRCGSPLHLSTRTCLLALGAAWAVSIAGPASAITYLDPKHAPFHIAKAQSGISTSVVSLFFSTSGEQTTPGGFARSGQASGVLLDLGVDNVWMITSGHNLAPVGRFDEDPLSFNAEVNVGLDSLYNTSNSVNINEWYVSSGFGDNAGVISANDIALAPLPFTPAEIEALGYETVSIFTRDTPAEFIDEVQGSDVEIVGFGESGSGNGLSSFDGVRRWGMNRVEPWIDSPSRVSNFANDNYLAIDFDVDRDDDLYDGTPDNSTDLNPVWENSYQTKNIGEVIASGGLIDGGLIATEPRQIPEEDFRIPFEVGLAPGDSGGGVFLGGALLGIPTSVRAVGQDTDGDGDEDTIGFGYTSQAEMLTLNELADDIADLIFFAENARNEFVLGTNPAREDAFLTEDELTSLGFRLGTTFTNPIFNFEDQVELEPRPFSLTTGPEIEINNLLVAYHAGDSLSAVDKAKLIRAISVNTPDDISDDDLIALIDNGSLQDMESLEEALDDDLVLFYGEPTIGRAIYASRGLTSLAVNYDAPERSSVPGLNINEIGDFNASGGFDADDLDAFAADGLTGSEWSDLNEDGVYSGLDMAIFVESVLQQLMGDANLDGVVDQADLDAVLTGWGQQDRGWGGGDFDGLAGVDQFDLDAVLLNWGSSLAPSFEGSVVPEPATLAVLGLSGLALLRRRSA